VSDLTSAPVPPLRADDHVRGEPHAPLVIFYADFTCPRCAVAHDRLLRSGLRVAYRHFALRARHSRAVALACAAEAAAVQGRFWEMCDSLYADPSRIDDPHLWRRARALDLDIERFDADRRLPVLATRVRDHLHGAVRAGLTVTPSLIIGDKIHPGPPDAAQLARLAGVESKGRRLP
jgi:protein-disulfide isomerase